MDQDMSAMSETAHETLRAFAQYLVGRGPVPDLDALGEDDRKLVEDLMPAVLEVINDHVVPLDEDHDALALGNADLVGVGLVDGRRLRAAREAAGLTAHDLAVRVSGKGRTIDSRMVDEMESTVRASIDDDLLAAFAEALGVPPRELTLGPDHVRRAVIEDIEYAHPPAMITLDQSPLLLALEPSIRLVLLDFAYVVRVLVFDVAFDADLQTDEPLRVAKVLLESEPDTDLFLLVAGADPERVTQVVDAADLCQALFLPGGDRLARPRRHSLVLQDAVRYAFEDLRATWTDDGDLTVGFGDFVDTSDLATTCSGRAIAAATKSKPRIEAKRDAFANIGEGEAARLAALLRAIAHGDLSVIDFGETFDSEVVEER